jgi:hypothetical protein
LTHTTLSNRAAASSGGFGGRTRGFDDSANGLCPAPAFQILIVKRTVWNHIDAMKSAYELAMERLNKTAPATKLTAGQKKMLAELDSRYAAKIAEREIALNGEIVRAADDVEKEESLREQLVNERRKLQAELEQKKEQVRAGDGG